MYEGYGDPTVIEAASWRLASELVRRHPERLRLIRGHPKSGSSDMLWLFALDGTPGEIALNRIGAIHVPARFDGRPSEWKPVDWQEQLLADPREFLHRIEAAAGLPAPPKVPPTTPRSLTLRVLAAIAATAFKTPKPIDIEMGFIDTAGYGGGPNAKLQLFTGIDRQLLAARDDDFYGEPGYRFWVVNQAGEPVLCFEHESASAWTRHTESTYDLMSLYDESRRHLLVTALKILRRVDHG
jgi:hypothetical protein